MKPRSANFYVTVIFIAGTTLLLLIGLNMVYRIHEVDKEFNQNHIDTAYHELKQAIVSVQHKAEEIAVTIATWDETSQQLSDPTYYTFWRERRVHAVNFIPIYVNDIELYDKRGKRLPGAHDTSMPVELPDLSEYLNIESGYAWLYLYKPVLLYKSSDQVFGYIGMKIDFLAALLDVNVFTHVDVNDIEFQPKNSLFITPDKFIRVMQIMDVHKGELDLLKQVIYQTFKYIVAWVLLGTFVVYWLVYVMFARPLKQLNQYINGLESSNAGADQQVQSLRFPIGELNHFARSISEYHQRLTASQQTLQKLNMNLEQRVESRTLELQSINRELESFSYSVSHDLRAPLRRIDGFCQALLEDYSNKLDAQGQEYLQRVILNTHQMADLIDDLLDLSRIARMQMKVASVNLSKLVESVVQLLREQYPDRNVKVNIRPDIFAYGDTKLLMVLLNNIVGNAWKYTGKTPDAHIEFGSMVSNDETVYFVKDNGAGFDMQYVDKVFEVFQRLHGSEFDGTGIGLATAYRIIKRHNGNIWADSQVNRGACFYFTLHPIITEIEDLYMSGASLKSVVPAVRNGM